MADGGRTALSGYLYQMIAAWGMLAWAETLEAPPSGTELDALIGLLRDGGRARHEAEDQDLGIDLKEFGLERRDEYVLVQFKYSSQRSPKHLGPREVAKIITGFRRSRRAVQALGRDISRYVVITNRPITTRTSALLPPTVDDVPLSIVKKIPDDLWKQKLSSFAYGYGCFDEQISIGIDTLVGQLANATVHDPSKYLSREQLVRAFTGYATARPLTCSAIAEEEDNLFLTFKRGLNLLGSPVERAVLDQLDREILRRALILVIGQGGVGKSVALWEWICRQRERMAEGEPPIATMRIGDEVTENYLADIARQWTHDWERVSARGGDTPEHMLLRLRLANPGAPHPVFELGLDGLDEDINRLPTNAVRRLVLWFWKEDQQCRAASRPPQATLVVTCRDEHEFYSQWLCIEEPSDTPDDEDAPALVEVKRFTWQELHDAARDNAPELMEPIEFRQRSGSTRQDVISRPSLGTYTAMPTELLQPLSAAEPGNVFSRLEPSNYEISALSDVLNLLRNPVLWRAYQAATPAQRNSILAGDEAGFDILAFHTVRRFCYKARRRGIDIRPEVIGNALRPLAQSCPATNATSYTLREWSQGLSAFHPRDSSLWEEALSAGLIHLEAKTEWQWSYAFVCAYLAKVGGSDLRRHTTIEASGDEDDE